jgi:hypothetical protein
MGEHALSLMVLLAIGAIVLSIEQSIIAPLNQVYLTIGHMNKTDVPKRKQKHWNRLKRKREQ